MSFHCLVLMFRDHAIPSYDMKCHRRSNQHPAHRVGRTITRYRQFREKFSEFLMKNTEVKSLRFHRYLLASTQTQIARNNANSRIELQGREINNSQQLFPTNRLNLEVVQRTQVFEFVRKG